MSCDIGSEGVQLLATGQGVNSRDADASAPTRIQPMPLRCRFGDGVHQGFGVAGELLCSPHPHGQLAGAPRQGAEVRPSPALRNARSHGDHVPAAAPRGGPRPSVISPATWQSELSGPLQSRLF